MWPVYLSIGNISSNIRRKPSLGAYTTIAFVPVPPKIAKLKDKEADVYRDFKIRVLQEVICSILNGFYSEDNVSFTAYCADGNFRCCVPKLVGWMGDYPEHIKIQGLKYGQCFWCEADRDTFGDEIAMRQQRVKRRDHVEYQRQYSDLDGTGREYLQAANVLPMYNPLWNLQGPLKLCKNIADLPKPDILHTIHLGVIQHLANWLMLYLNEVGCLDIINAACRSVPAYLTEPAVKTTYDDVKNWAGKDIQKISKNLLACTYIALRGVNQAQKRDASKAIRTTRSLLEFSFYCSYNSHDSGTIAQMRDVWAEFHENKTVFTQFRAGVKAKATATKLRKDLLAERDAELRQFNGSVRETEILKSDWKIHIDAEIRSSLAAHSDFALPKLHLISHFTELIALYGALAQYSQQTGERCHIENIKNAYKCTNRSESFEDQVIEYNLRHEAFRQRDLNISAINRNNLPVSSPNGKKDGGSRVKLDSGQKNIKNVFELVEYIQIPQFYKELCSYCEKLYKNSTVFSIDPIQESLIAGMSTVERSLITVFHRFLVYSTEYGTENTVVQTVRCTGKESWMSQSPRNDWVWRNVPGNAKHGALHGALPVKLLHIFRLVIHNNVYGYYGEHELALVETTIACNGGKPDADSGLVRVKRDVGRPFVIVDIAELTGAAQCIPDKPLLPKKKQHSWVVNSHVDLETWNTVYSYDE